MTHRYVVVATAPYQDTDINTGEAISHPSGFVANAVAWDGVSEWSPPNGFQVLQDDAGQYQVGSVKS